MEKRFEQAASAVDEREGGLLDCLGTGADAHPGKFLAVTLDGSITYSRSYLLAVRLVQYLLFNCKMRKGATAIVYLANCVELPSILAAGQAMGLRMVFRAPSLLESCIYDDARLVDPDLFFVESDAAAEAVRRVGFGQRVITLRGQVGAGEPLAHVDVMAIRDDIGPHVADPGEAQVVLFTSGSTGRPKGIVNRMASFMYNARRLTAGLGITADDVLYAPVPAFHVYGMVSIFAAAVRRATWAMLPKYSVDESLDLVEQARVTARFCVPTMLIRESKRDRDGLRDLSSLRLCMVAGDTCGPDVLAGYEERYGCTVVLSYGMSETAATLTVEDPAAAQDVRLASQGRAIEGVSFGIDPDTSEVLVKTPSLMLGMLTEDGFSARVTDDEGWYHTGDAGWLDEAGRLYFTGRIRNIIVRGGANIHPSQVEAVYREHPGVVECAVVGYPDEELGERICLLVVPEGDAALDLGELRAFADGKLEKGSLPDKLVKIERIPCLANGKRDGEALKKLAAEIAVLAG